MKLANKGRTMTNKSETLSKPRRAALAALVGVSRGCITTVRQDTRDTRSPLNQGGGAKALAASSRKTREKKRRLKQRKHDSDNR